MFEPALIDLIELHERKWGEHGYPGRPALSALMTAPIVAVWRAGKRFMLSAHQEPDELSAIIFAILTGKDPNPQDRKLYMVYAGKRIVPFTVKIVSLPQSERPAKDEQPAQVDELAKVDQPVPQAQSPIKFVFPRRPIPPPGIAVTSAPRTTPIIHSINPMPEGTPAFYEPEKIMPDDPNVKPGRNTELYPGRQVEWLSGRDVSFINTLDELLQRKKTPIKQARIYRGEKS